MSLKAPKFGTWLTSLILGTLGALINFDIVDMSIKFIDLDLGLWLMLIALAMMLAASFIKGL